MKEYILYTTAGLITQTGTCPDGTFERMREYGENLMEGVADHTSNYVESGIINTYTSEELQIKNNLPQGWIWAMPERIAVDMRSLDAAKLQAWSRIKKARTTAELSPFTYADDIYDADKAQISGAVQMALLAQLAGAPFSIDWTLNNNSVRSLSAAEMIAVGVALGEHVALVYDIGRTLREQIETCTTPAELDTIGWPVQ